MKKVLLTLSMVFTALLSFSNGVVNVYTSRHYDSDKLVFDEFEKETGIKVNVYQNKDVNAIIKKMELEGKDSPADVFITVGIGDLYNAKTKGLLQPFTSKTVRENTDKRFNDKDNYYTGLTYRARVIVYNPKTVNVNELSTYEDLANPKWKGRLLTRSSTSSYNRHLVSFMISKLGRDKALKWTKGIVENLARTPKGNDRDQSKAVLAGLGDIAIMNSYYMGLMSASNNPIEAEVFKNLRLFFPNQKDDGVHVNISGVGIAKNAKNLKNAEKLIEFLTSKTAQDIYTQKNFEFPVNKNAEKPAVVKSWGDFKISKVSFDSIGQNLKEAQFVSDEAGFK